MAHEIFVVRVAQNGKVDNDPVKLSLREKQRLVWVSDADMDYKMEFKADSPFGFNKRTFEVPAKKSCDPGPVTATVEKSYHYDAKPAVALEAELVTAEVWQPDPEIIVTS